MKLIILVSGKRTCGKDTFAQILKQLVPDINITSFARELKLAFCKDRNYDFDRMISDYPYKEAKREEMTEYFVNMQKTHGDDYFFNAVLKNINESDSKINVISDLRLKSDLNRFLILDKSEYTIFTVRIESSIKSRMLRGFVMKEYDFDVVETDLDDYKFDTVIENNDTINKLMKSTQNWLSMLELTLFMMNTVV